MKEKRQFGAAARFSRSTMPLCSASSRMHTSQPLAAQPLDLGLDHWASLSHTTDRCPESLKPEQQRPIPSSILAVISSSSLAPIIIKISSSSSLFCFHHNTHHRNRFSSSRIDVNLKIACGHGLAKNSNVTLYPSIDWKQIP